MPVASRPSVDVSGLRRSASPIAWARPCLPLAASARTSVMTASWSPWPRSSFATSGPRSSTRRARAPVDRSAGTARLRRPTARGAVRSRRATPRARAIACAARLSVTDDVQPGAVLEPEAIAPREVLVDRLAASRPGVVVVQDDAAAGHQERCDAGEAGHRRLVPVAIEVRQCDGLVELDRVLEEALDELDVVVDDGHVVPRECVDHLVVKVVSVAVVRVAARPPRLPGRDLREAPVDVGAVA